MNYTVRSAVANIWTAPASPRKADQPMLGKTVRVREWLEEMTYDQRLCLCTENIIQSQVLFGGEVTVVSEKEEWVSVVVPGQPSGKNERGYPGWMRKCQLSKMDETHKQGAVYVSKPAAFLYKNDREKEMEVSFLTSLPLYSESDGFYKVETPFGDRLLKKTDAQPVRERQGTAADIIQTGKAFIGLPYLWGGMSGFGFDCSGFMYSIFKANGYIIPRDAGDQAKAGSRIEIDEMEPGDLLFFAYEEGKGAIHHVGLAIGGGRMLHSPKTGKSIEIITLKGTVYEKELCTARRYYIK
ncbi:C40 family peptidase [Bacillus atrophaeus]|uniref:C40 family peptidase n=1 Tax=Bacillus atrophaeus TaxID=1452 RepID=UPI000779D74B|nr:C40 family peptidase [Bacillus atrophaeus]